MAFDAGAIVGRLTLQGMGEFAISMRRVRESVQQTERGTRTFRDSLQSLERAGQSAIRQILSMAAAFGIATTATQAVGRAWQFARAQFTAGITAIEDIRQAAISTAAVLTSMARDPSPQTFARNLQFAEEQMIKLNLAAARFLATGQEMRLVFQAFALRGILPVTDRDIDNLGRITDAILAFTKGQPGVERQLFQEVAAIIEGRVIPGMTRVSEFIQQQVGDLKQWVAQHREAGTLIPAIAEQLKGFTLAQGAISNLLDTQLNTFKSILDLVRQRAFVQPHQDIVNLVRSVNQALLDERGQLTPLAQEIADKVTKAWKEFKAQAEAAVQFVKTDVIPAITNIKAALGEIKSIWDELPSEAKEFGLLGLLLLGVGAQKTIRLLVAAGAIKAVEGFGQQARLDRLAAQLQARGIEPPIFVGGGPTTGNIEALIRETEEAVKQQTEALRAMAEARIERMRVERGLDIERGRGFAPGVERGPAAFPPPPLGPEAAEKIEAGIRQMQERLAKLRGEGFRAEIAAVELQTKKLLDLAKGHAGEEAKIRQASQQLTSEMNRKYLDDLFEAQRKKNEELLDLESQALSEQLTAQGRTFEARLEQLRRAFEKERDAIGDNAAKRLFSEQTYQAQLVQLATQARDAILTIDRQMFEERTKLGQALLSLEERIAAIRIGALERARQTFDPGSQAFDDMQKRIQAVRDQLQRLRDEGFTQQIEALQRMKAAFDPVFDADRIRQANQELGQVFQQQAVARAEDLQRQAAEAFERAERLLTEGRPDLAEMAKRQGEALSTQAIAELRSAQDKIKALGEESIKVLIEQREKRLGEFRRIFDELLKLSGAATQQLGDQFTAVSTHIVKSISDAVRAAAAQLTALTGTAPALPQPGTIGGFTLPTQQPIPVPPPPPARSPALQPPGGGWVAADGRVVVIEGNLVLELQIPEWIRDPQQLKEFIERAVREFMAAQTRRSP